MEYNLKNICGLKGLQGLKDSSVDLILTSPPYNMRLRVRNGKYTTREKASHFSKKYNHFSDDLSIDEYYKFHKNVLSECIRVSKLTLWNISIVTGSKEAVFKLIGYFNQNIRDIIIWDKGHGQPAMHDGVLNRATELIIIFSTNKKPGRYIENFNFERGTLDDIWRNKRGKSTSTNSAVMNETIAGRAILSFSKKGDLICDPFAGTGTTFKAAHRYDRRCIGYEISEKQYLKTKKELDEIFKAKKLF